jgi:hypothetical protein
MTRLGGGSLTLALTAAAIAAAGCGGPNGTTGTGASGSGASVLPASTPISSPTYRAFAERGLAQIPGVPRSAIPKIVDCVIQRERSQGITTVGALRDHQSQVRADGVACAHQAGLN